MENLSSEEKKSELIQEEFVKLNSKCKPKTSNQFNQGYAGVHQVTMNEIIFLGLSLQADEVLNKSPAFPGMPALTYPNSWKECSLNTAAKQIKKLKTAIKKSNQEKLQIAFEAMYSTTIHALLASGFQQHDIHKLDASILDKATDAIEEWKKEYPELISKRSGQPEKKVALHISKILAEEYYNATGKKPTVITDAINAGHYASGDFLDLHEKVFKILGIKASPESMARDTRKLWNDRQDALDAIEKKLKTSD